MAERSPEPRRSCLHRGYAGDDRDVERGTMPGTRNLMLRDMTEAAAPYFSLVLVPGRRGQG